MPFWRKDKKNSESSNGHDKPKEKVNYKARLEHKQYLAQESPEPVYDISDCGLKSVPSGVFSKCKVLRKEALLLQNNELTQLCGGGILSEMAEVLQVLDLRSNQLEKLPDEIGSLKQLKVLYLQKNRLKRLPDSLSNLSRLQSLDVSHNLLKEFPSCITQLARLAKLDVRGNAKLVRLDKNLAHVRTLEKLDLDPDSMQYPDVSVCQEGTQAIMKFLCKECDIDYVSPSEYTPPDDVKDDSTSKNGKVHSNGLDDDAYDKIVRGNLKLMEKQREEKLKEMLAMQRELEASQEKEAKLAASVQSNKQKLLNDLANEEARRDEAVKRLQAMKEKEKSALVDSLYSAENRTDTLISELVKYSQRNSDPKRVLEEMERERKEMEELFSIKAGEEGKLRENEVKREMQRMMEEEMKREQVRRHYEAGRKDIINTALTTDLENDKQVDKILQTKGKHQKDLISNLLDDEKYQREAFTALFLKQDTRHKEISQQVEQIQDELASLTMIEMTKKDLKMEFEKDVMAEKRETLTKLLMNLMEQKNERAKELQSRLREMDDQRNKDTENYWLIQYQKLLDSKPKNIQEAEKKIDPDLKEVLEKAGAEDFIPVFALKGIGLKQLSYMKDKEIAEELGIHNAYTRQRLLMLAQESQAPSAPPLAAEPSAPAALSNEEEAAMAQKKLAEGAPTPSAPPAPSGTATTPKPSAPVETYQSTECVVCMENKCDIIFLPCGHVCCCWTCESGLSSCPLCRVAIVQKVRLH